MSKHRKFDFRDVSTGLKILREFLLGRKHTLHGRFPPLISSRSIPPPDIPRGPDDKYSSQYYFTRTAFDSVLPPVVAPVAAGPPLDQDPTQKVKAGGMRPDTICFQCAPTPGPPWWWDGHCYYDYVPDSWWSPGAEPTPCPPARPPGPPCGPSACPPVCCQPGVPSASIPAAPKL